MDDFYITRAVVWEAFTPRLEHLKWLWLEEYFAPDCNPNRLAQLRADIVVVSDLDANLIILN